MITKRNTVICDECGLFCKFFDEYTHFGTKDYDYPEPLDPNHICEKCFPKKKRGWKKYFEGGGRSGDWQKSRAEREAATEGGLMWVGSNGVGTLGTKDFFGHYRYLEKAEYDRLSALPYWGYCKECGAERKNGYCSDEKCKESFKVKTAPQDAYKEIKL